LGPRKTRRHDRWACRASLIADKLFGPPAPFASESDEVRLGFPDLVPGYHHDRAAVQARRIVSGVQRIEQEFLVAGHSVLAPRPNFQPERWLLCDPLQPPRRLETHRRTGGLPRCDLIRRPAAIGWLSSRAMQRRSGTRFRARRSRRARSRRYHSREGE